MTTPSTNEVGSHSVGDLSILSPPHVSWFGKNKSVVFGVVFIFIVANTIAATLYLRKKGLLPQEGPGKIESFVLTKGTRPTLLLIESFEYPAGHSPRRGYRWTHVDPTTGFIQTRNHVADGHIKKGMYCEAATKNGDLVWCKQNDDLEVRNLATMMVLTDTRRLQNLSSDLKTGIRSDQPMIVDRDSGEIEVETNVGGLASHGSRVAIKAASRATRVLSKEQDGAQATQSTNGASRVQLGLARFSTCTSAYFDDKKTEGLSVGGQSDPSVKVYFKRPNPPGKDVKQLDSDSDGDGDGDGDGGGGAGEGDGGAGVPSKVSPIGPETYLKGKILCNADHVLTLPSTDASLRAFVVTEQSSPDNSQSKPHLIALDEKGKKLWDLTIDKVGTLDHADIVDAPTGKILLVIIGAGTSAVAGIDPKTGRQLFLYNGSRD
jgi:hypothetical protein